MSHMAGEYRRELELDIDRLSAAQILEKVQENGLEDWKLDAYLGKFQNTQNSFYKVYFKKQRNVWCIRSLVLIWSDCEKIFLSLDKQFPSP